MRNRRFASLAMGIVLLLAVSSPVFAGPPLSNIEGVGGIALNPLAYTAGTAFDAGACKLGDAVAKPQIGMWYLSLSDTDVDWTSMSIADTFFKRLELSYGYEAIDIGGAAQAHKYNLGAKALIVTENMGGMNFMPAVSVGMVYKKTSAAGAGVDDEDADFYLVATKLITQLPKPVLVSAGVLSTKGYATGALGFDEDRDTTFFGNIDVLPLPQLAIGLEYKQGASFDDFENASYYDIHAAWFVNKSLSLVGAYVDTGDEESSSKVGLGDGVTFSVQYAF
jgi:hypothetical protein